jgi:hypothetical protein
MTSRPHDRTRMVRRAPAVVFTAPALVMLDLLAGPAVATLLYPEALGIAARPLASLLADSLAREMENALALNKARPLLLDLPAELKDRSLAVVMKVPAPALPEGEGDEDLGLYELFKVEDEGEGLLAVLEEQPMLPKEEGDLSPAKAPLPRGPMGGPKMLDHEGGGMVTGAGEAHPRQPFSLMAAIRGRAVLPDGEGDGDVKPSSAAEAQPPSVPVGGPKVLDHQGGGAVVVAGEERRPPPSFLMAAIKERGGKPVKKAAAVAEVARPPPQDLFMQIKQAVARSRIVMQSGAGGGQAEGADASESDNEAWDPDA